MSWWLDLALILSLTITLLHMSITACYLIKSMIISCEIRLLISRNKLIFKFSTMWVSIFILSIMNLSLNHVSKLKWKIATSVNEFACLISHTEIKKILNETYSVFYFLKKALLTKVMMHSISRQMKTWSFACWI